MSLPVVWMPEAIDELNQARRWYGSIRPELANRFALSVEAIVDVIADLCNFHRSTEAVAEPECAVSLMD